MNIALLKAAGKWGGIFTIIALVIALLRQAIDLIAFVMMAFKLILIVGFFALVAFIGLVAYRTFTQRKREREEL